MCLGSLFWMWWCRVSTKLLWGFNEWEYLRVLHSRKSIQQTVQLAVNFSGQGEGERWGCGGEEEEGRERRKEERTQGGEQAERGLCSLWWKETKKCQVDYAQVKKEWGRSISMLAMESASKGDLQELLDRQMTNHLFCNGNWDWYVAWVDVRSERISKVVWNGLVRDYDSL